MAAAAVGWDPLEWASCLPRNGTAGMREGASERVCVCVRFARVDGDCATIILLAYTFAHSCLCRFAVCFAGNPHSILITHAHAHAHTL